MERRRSTRDRSRGPKAKPPPEQLPGRKKKPAAKKITTNVKALDATGDDGDEQVDATGNGVDNQVDATGDDGCKHVDATGDDVLDEPLDATGDDGDEQVDATGDDGGKHVDAATGDDGDEQVDATGNEGDDDNVQRWQQQIRLYDSESSWSLWLEDCTSVHLQRL